MVVISNALRSIRHIHVLRHTLIHYVGLQALKVLEELKDL